MVVILTLCPNYWVTTLTYSILTHSTLLKLLIVIPIKRSGMRNLIYESIIVQFITGRICPSPFIVAPRVGAWIETTNSICVISCTLSHPAWVGGLKPVNAKRFNWSTISGCDLELRIKKVRA